MKNGILLLLLLSAVAMGYLLGRHSVADSRSSTSQHEVRSSARPKTTSSSAEKESNTATRKLSLAEIEEKIRGLKISDYRWGTDAPQAWLELFDQISAEDMLEVMNFVAQNCPANLQRLLQRGLCGHWADIDPQGALNFANHLSNKVDRQIAINLIISDWSANDPAAAMAWAKQLPAGSFRNEVLNGVITGMAATDPKGALELYRVPARILEPSISHSNCLAPSSARGPRKIRWKRRRQRHNYPEQPIAELRVKSSRLPGQPLIRRRPWRGLARSQMPTKNSWR